MRVSGLILLSLLFVACGPTGNQDGFGQVEQAWSGPPNPPIVCDESKVLCGTTCVDISRDMQNCGDCDNKCRVADGEFCLAYYCRNVRDYGFTLEPNGPRQYDVRRDLPRPNPMQSRE
jgi:hypothetical protein